MSMTVEEILKDLEDGVLLGEILESDCQTLRFKLLKGLADRGAPVPHVDATFVQTEAIDSRGVPFCHIAAGPFLFGAGNEIVEAPAACYMARYPVTVAEFVDFLETTGYDYPEEDLLRMRQISPHPNCPVANVSWADARQYCRWVRQCTHEYYHLPNEVEWEKAARGGDGRLYPWGHEGELSQLACYDHGGDSADTVPVDAFPDNISPAGCVGMVGNVWEWCSDAVEEPEGAHMLRGGSYLNTAEHITVIARSYAYPAEKRVPYAGFRMMYLPQDMLIEYQRMHRSRSISEKTSLTATHFIRTSSSVATSEKEPESIESASLIVDLDAVVEADNQRGRSYARFNREIRAALQALDEAGSVGSPRPGASVVVPPPGEKAREVLGRMQRLDGREPPPTPRAAPKTKRDTTREAIHAAIQEAAAEHAKKQGRRPGEKTRVDMLPRPGAGPRLGQTPPSTAPVTRPFLEARTTVGAVFAVWLVFFVLVTCLLISRVSSLL